MRNGDDMKFLVFTAVVYANLRFAGPLRVFLDRQTANERRPLLAFVEWAKKDGEGNNPPRLLPRAVGKHGTSERGVLPLSRCSKIWKVNNIGTQ